MQKDLKTYLKESFSKAFNLSVLEKKRMAWVDYLRGIAILLVVYRHVLLGLQRGNMDVPNSLVYANMIFYSFRMPLFFILSGVFINGSLSRRSLGKIVYTKFENLLYPYLVWSFIQITLQIVLSRYANSDRGLKDYAFILYQPRALDQFWYLPALFNTTIIYLLVKTKLHPPAWAQLLLGIILYFLSPHLDAISMLSDWMEFYIFFALGDTISDFFLKESTQNFLKKPVTLVWVTPVFILTQVYYLSRPVVTQGEFLAIALIGCFSMFVLAFRMQEWGFFPFLRVLGFHSLFIYVQHVIVAAFVRAFLVRVVGLHQPVILLLCGIAAGVIIPVIVYNLLIKDNIFWFLFTPKRTEKEKKAKTPAAAA